MTPPFPNATAVSGVNTEDGAATLPTPANTPSPSASIPSAIPKEIGATFNHNYQELASFITVLTEDESWKKYLADAAQDPNHGITAHFQPVEIHQLKVPTIDLSKSIPPPKEGTLASISPESVVEVPKSHTLSPSPIEIPKPSSEPSSVGSNPPEPKPASEEYPSEWF
jgi:hypothetical protein